MKATDEQVAALMRLMSSGAMRYEDAQAIIKAFTPDAFPSYNPEEDIFAPKRMPHLALLEKRFRENGAQFVELVVPFFRWRPSLKALNPALVKAGTTAYDVLIWKARAFACSQMDELRRCRMERCEAILIPNTGCHGMDMVAIELFQVEAVASALSKSSLVSHMGGLPPWILETLIRSLAEASADLLTSTTPASFYAPFFRMWLEGNWPLGISKEKELLLLVAD